jgi:hypothetical protein
LEAHLNGKLLLIWWELGARNPPNNFRNPSRIFSGQAREVWGASEL